MVQSIYFDQETRTFTFKETMGKVGGHLARNERKYIGGASAAVGATAGAIVAKKNAEKKAAEAGLEKGTPEYKKAVRAAAIKGAAIGGAAGGAASELGHFGVRTAKAMAPKSEDSKFFKRLGKAAGETGKSMYVDPAVNAWRATGGKVFKKKEA